MPKDFLNGLEINGETVYPGYQDAIDTDVITTNFLNILNVNDTNVQLCLDKLDNYSYSKNDNILINNPHNIIFESIYRENITLFNTTLTDMYWDNVVLLLHFNNVDGRNTFNDNSKHSHNLTNYGNACISDTQYKFGISSLYLDGSGDYITAISNSNFIINGDYSIEGWFYSLDDTNIKTLFSFGNSPYWYVYKTSNQQLVFCINGVDRITSNINLFTKNVWHHVEINRSSNTNYLFLNGLLIGSYYDDTNINQSDFNIGYTNNMLYNTFNGYIDEFRFTNGNARHIYNFNLNNEEYIESYVKFAIGSQVDTLYMRSSGSFAWYKNGNYINSKNEPGVDGILQMVLSENGNLIIGGVNDDVNYKLQVNGDILIDGFNIKNSTQGQILYHNGLKWERLNPGIVGQVLTTKGYGVNPEWSSMSTLTLQTLIDGATIAWDMLLGSIACVILGGNRILNNPTNKRVGEFFLFIRQDTTGGRTLTFSSDYKFPGNVAPILSTAANALDVVHMVYDGTTLVSVANYSIGSAQ